MDLSRILYNNIHSSIIHNSQKVKTTRVHQQMSGYTKYGISTQWNIIQP